MAEIRNTFIKSKMNKDLDDRLLPNGEYRDAQNVAISRSEGDDVGALENIQGNALVSVTALTSGNNYLERADLSIIGQYVSESTSCVYIFLTNFVDASPASNVFASNDSLHFIYQYNQITQIYTKLVEGYYLNFSKINPVIGVNLLENFLFWTDNRNQPRKIDIPTALNDSSYYGNEDSISVARYNPWRTISLTNAYALAPGVAATESTMINPADKILPDGATALANGTQTGQTTINIDHFLGTQVVDTPVNPNSSPLVYSNFILIGQTITGTGVPSNTTVVSVTASGDTSTPTPPTVIGLSNAVTITDNTSLTFNVNPQYNSTWPGDPNFLESKFVRFSYRFQFDDNTYSLMAPFTQQAYIPKQQGYFLTGNEDSAYQSTILSWFENNVTEIMLGIEFETRTPSIDHKISSVDILYKESDALVVKVVETVPIVTVEKTMSLNANNKTYNYKYISNKPYKTLTQDQTTRVYDKVPTRALAQEITSNRITYGNFYDEQSPPASLDYRVGYSDKTLALGSSEIEYPNHTVKQNRNYQVGVVLADRFGRQSSVILSTADTSATESNVLFGGSTIYLPYKPETGTSVINWPGYALRTLFNSPIPSTINSLQGYPGLYKDANNAIDNLIIYNAGTGYIVENGVECTGLDDGMFINITEVNAAGGITAVVLTAQPPEPSEEIRNNRRVIVDSGNNNAVLQLVINPPNPLGWYSYKIVVRQTEQDYYNSYLPGILNGYPSTYVTSPPGGATTFEQGQTANIVLINDNINKIPRDLSEVGPDQKQYRSSVRLFGRVTPRETVGTGQTNSYNMQWYPDVFADTVTSISTLRDSNFNGTGLDVVKDPNINYVEFYQTETNPSIARISTKQTYEPIDNGLVTQISIGKVNTGAVVTPANYTLVVNEDLKQVVGSTAQNYFVNANTPEILIPSGGTYAGGATFFVTLSIAGNVFNCQVRSPGSTDAVDPLDKTIEFDQATLRTVFGNSGTGSVSFTITPNCIDTTEAITTQNPYPLNLAVYETEPVESLLDIYWETSTSGIVSELNSAIVVGGYPGAVESGGFTVDFDEEDGKPLATAAFNTSEVFSNAIQALDATGAIITSNITFSDLTVLDDANVIRSTEFSLQDLGNASFKVWTRPGAFFVYNQNAAIRVFNMSVKCTVVSNGQNFESTIEMQAPLGNVTPKFLNPGSGWPQVNVVAAPVLCPQIEGCATDPDGARTRGYTTSINQQLVFTFYAGNGSNCLGGKAQEELKFVFKDTATAAVLSNFNLVDNNDGSCSINANANAVAGTYLIPVTVKDAAGDGLTNDCSVTIILFDVSGTETCRTLIEVKNFGSTAYDLTGKLPSCEDGTPITNLGNSGIVPALNPVTGEPGKLELPSAGGANRCVRFSGWLAPNLTDNFDNEDGTGWGELSNNNISYGFNTVFPTDCAPNCVTYEIETISGAGGGGVAGTFSWTDCNDVDRGPVSMSARTTCVICTRYQSSVTVTGDAVFNQSGVGPCTTPGPTDPLNDPSQSCQ